MVGDEMTQICKTCDSYGVIIKNGITETCPDPNCTGYKSHAEYIQMLKEDFSDIRPQKNT